MLRVEVEYEGKRHTTKLGGDSMLDPGDTITVDFPGAGWVKATVVSCEILPSESDKRKSDDSLLMGAVTTVTIID